jgi:hypothetical protein
MEYSMSKRNKGMIAPLAAQTLPTDQSAEQTTEQPTAPESTVAPVAPEQPVRRSLHMARDANASNPAVDPTAPQRAVLVRPAKGENPERRKVFGYDNGPGGKVPTQATVVVISKDGLKSAYPSLAEALEATPTATVGTLKSAGVASKSFRRAFRSGLIRFSKSSEQ